MILYPPMSFDENEWLIIIFGLIIWVIMIKLPKRFSGLVILLIWTLSIFLTQVADFTLAIKPYDLYDIMDRPEYEIFDIIIYYLIYPPMAYFALYFYDKWKFQGWKLIFYVLFCTTITIGFEWIADQFNVFTYKGWKLYYSPFVYVLVYAINIATLEFIQHYFLKRDSKSQ